ncbi:beta-lactam-binding protein with PASTA domain [Silvibacterium bohemicum]|uniref:Beta-lactam-binding protein with PASTA domain n=1 Tax=Silvibacterium bohemicum TaxID=1577686 RepID=A0A841K008_9BACT|nr:hypothetical protein [Silvibacterium bohemicum]MBB6145947.1 beta-lactam-binding protein with PASTA domain [Silvibacterium bohemicum]
MAEAAKQQEPAEEQAKNQPQPSVQPVEPPDPRQAGQATHRAVVNKDPKDSERHPQEAPGQHATGSFTTNDEK